MQFTTEDEAKIYCTNATSIFYTTEEVLQKIDVYNGFISNSTTEESRELWKERIDSLEEWISSKEFKEGNYSQGIDALILDLIEWRASIYSFQKVETVNDPFNQNAFHAQWLVGGIYAIFSIIGKLVSKDSRDNSLRKLWSSVHQYIKKEDFCTELEIKLLNEKMHKNNGHFTNLNSKSILYRNKFVSHNESTPLIEWAEIDKDIQLLARLWSLITMWASAGIMCPFRTGESAFSGLENLYSVEEIKDLIRVRQEYLNMFESWCATNIEANDIATQRTPFVKISFGIG